MTTPTRTLRKLSTVTVVLLAALCLAAIFTMPVAATHDGNTTTATTTTTSSSYEFTDTGVTAETTTTTTYRSGVYGLSEKNATDTDLAFRSHDTDTIETSLLDTNIAAVLHSTLYVAPSGPENGVFGVLSTPGIRMYGFDVNPVSSLSEQTIATELNNRHPSANITHTSTTSGSVASTHSTIATFRVNHPALITDYHLYIATYEADNGDQNIVFAAHEWTGSTPDSSTFDLFDSVERLN